MSEVKTNKISSLDSSNSDITIDPDGTGDTIVASGNLGVGTTSPSQALEISGDAPIIRLTDTGASNNYSELNADYTSGSLQISADTANASPNSRIIFAVDNTERMRITNAGAVIFGATATSAPSLYFTPSADGGYLTKDANTTSATTAYDFKINATRVGAITTSGSSTSYATSSDHRLKENAVDMTGAITRVKQLAPKRFNFIADADTTVDGFLAHEAQTVVPEAVTGTKDAMRNEEYEVTPAVLDDDGNVVTEAVMGIQSVPDYQGIDQSKLVPLLTGALQEAIAKIETLEARVTALENA